jgi:hypothetical protein
MGFAAVHGGMEIAQMWSTYFGRQPAAVQGSFLSFPKNISPYFGTMNAALEGARAFALYPGARGRLAGPSPCLLTVGFERYTFSYIFDAQNASLDLASHERRAIL